MQLTYLVDGAGSTVTVPDDTVFSLGEDICLAREHADITAGRPWFDAGYAACDARGIFDFAEVKEGVRAALTTIIREELPEVDLSGFALEHYHRYVPPEHHGRIIARTRRLYPQDFNFDTQAILAALGEMFGVRLSYANPVTNAEQWIIVRINPPRSIGFNPVHKDIYEAYDHCGLVPRMVNVWIPLCGVNRGTGLPVAPGSHLLKESAILRTRAGSAMEGQRYSVNCIARWGSGTSLTTVSPAEGEMLVFSSHLIHGLARNNNADVTRMSFEFRLYEAR